MNRKHILIVLASVVIIVILGVALMPFQIITYPVTDYGDIALYNENTLEEVSAGDILNVQDGDWMVAWLRYNPDKSHKPTDIDLEIFSTYLYRGDGSTTGEWIEDGRDREAYPADPTPPLYSSYRWWLDLDQCPQGTFTYFIRYFARLDANTIVKGNSFAFQITNSEAPVYDDAVVTVKPDDVGFDFDESAAFVQWTFSYDGPCYADVTWDGVKDDSQDYEASGADQIFTYLVNTSIAGIYEVIFTVTPDDTSNPSVSDTVMVTIAEPTVPTDTTTTDTTTTDTTTTTPTTTTDPPPTGPDYTIMWVLLAAVVVVAIIVKAAK